MARGHLTARGRADHCGGVRSGAALMGVLATVACAGPQAPPAPPAPLQARVARIYPQPSSLDEAVMKITVEMFNPREDPVDLAGIEYTIEPEGMGGPIPGRSGTTGTLGAKEGAEIELTQAVPFPKEPTAYLAALERGTIPVQVTGLARFSDGTTAKFERRGAVATPRLPMVTVHDAQAARYDGGKGVDVTLFLRLNNENTFPVTVDEVLYEVTVSGMSPPGGKGKGKDIGVRLVASAVSEYEESVVIDDSTFGRKKVRSIIADGKVSYDVKGRINVRGMERPFELSGEIDLAGSD